MGVLAEHGIQTGVTMMPILPFIEDNADNISAIVEQAAASGASYILPWMGMTLRDRQRAYTYRQLERLFPGVKAKYERAYGERYSCNSPHADALYKHFTALCRAHNIATSFPAYAPQNTKQLSLF